MWPNLQFPADLITFTEEIFNICLPGDTGVPELQYSSFNSAVTFLKYFSLPIS